jgi:hypothetical protein
LIGGHRLVAVRTRKAFSLLESKLGLVGRFYERDLYASRLNSSQRLGLLLKTIRTQTKCVRTGCQRLDLEATCLAGLAVSHTINPYSRIRLTLNSDRPQ